MKLTANANRFIDSIMKELEDLKEEVSKAVSDASSDIAEVVVENVLNRDHWNDEARYQVGPRQGLKYDGVFSGQLLSEIRNNIYIGKSNAAFQIGIGNISALDALKTHSESSTSSYSQNFPYWRSFVYGRVGSNTHHFQWDGETFYPFGDAKPKGFILPGGSMAGTPGTYMFDNGFQASLGDIEKIMLEGLRNASRRVSRKWR